MVDSGGFQVRSNLSLVLRERGKIVTRREGHNIWLNFGRAWLANLITYSSFTPLTTVEDNRLAYFGFGIGGVRQSSPAVADNAPLSMDYPGTHVQSDYSPVATRLERPVRYTSPGAPTVPPYDPGDIWLKQISVPTHPQTTSLRMQLTVATTEISYGPYLTVPLSEIGLFPYGADIHAFGNNPVAYDTFETVPKTGAYDLTVTWTVRF